MIFFSYAAMWCGYGMFLLLYVDDGGWSFLEVASVGLRDDTSCQLQEGIAGDA